MAAFNQFDVLAEDLAEKVHDLGADTLKLMLVNSPAPAAGNGVKADLTEIAAGNGYTAGGNTITITASSQTSGTYSLVGNDVTFTASGGTMADFQYVVWYNDTPTSPADPLIGWWDNGEVISLNDTESLDVDFGSSILTMS